jgi:hypothetical protein
MKKLDLSEAVSNLFLLSSVTMALALVVMGGDQVDWIARGAWKEGWFMLDQAIMGVTAWLS